MQSNQHSKDRNVAHDKSGLQGATLKLVEGDERSARCVAFSHSSITAAARCSS